MINLQGWVSVKDLANSIKFFEQRGYMIRSRSDLIKALIGITNSNEFTSAEEAFEFLGERRFLPADEKSLEKIKKELKNERIKEIPSYEELAKTIIEGDKE